ncbi:hypothetical protein GCM10023213_00070 [Prosthecobacter algae]|uniref:Core-binding (CB) domain-containing protein n=1 Tax=Prosthecobacter algae TaxID=1144682 RepID=A0ABP9NUT9_9BACT
MKDANPTVKTWEKTRVQNLKRHKSGGYYARLFLNGKEVWKSLKTKHFSVAEARMADAQKEHRHRKSKQDSSSSAKMTFQQAADAHLQKLDEKVSIKKRTREYWREILAALLKSWPELSETEVRKITESGCREWAARFAKKSSPNRVFDSATRPLL